MTEAKKPHLRHGVYSAEVTAIDDPEGGGRVKVRLGRLGGDDGHELWARMAAPHAGNDRGLWMLPEVGDEVLVAFEAGDPRHPCVLGGLWSAAAPPPLPSHQADRRLIRTRAGHQIVLDDTEGAERIAIETDEGARIALDSSPGRIEIADGNGNSIVLSPAGIEISSGSQLSLDASTVEVAGAAIRLDAGATTCSGVLTADTVITMSVVSSTYTPGAGNLL